MANEFVLRTGIKLLGTTQSVGTYSLYINPTTGLVSYSTASTAGNIGAFGITVDGAGTALTTGSKGYVNMPYNGYITSWAMVANAASTIILDLKKSTYSDFPTTTSITGANYITMSSVVKNNSSVLTSWSLTFSTGDIYEFVINSASTATRINVTINTNKT